VSEIKETKLQVDKCLSWLCPFFNSASDGYPDSCNLDKYLGLTSTPRHAKGYRALDNECKLKVIDVIFKPK